MELTEAREIMAENGVEEGAKFDWCDETADDPAENVLGNVTVTGVRESGAGITDVEYEIECNGQTDGHSDTVRNVAKFIEMGSWQPTDEEQAEDDANDDDGDDDDEHEQVTDGGQVTDGRGYTLDDYPDNPDGEEQIVGLNEWGAWSYEPTFNKLRNYKREDGPGKKPLEETYEAEETISGEELVNRITDLDAITGYGYQLIYEHGDTEQAINALLRAGLAPGQAWAYYGVEIRGNSRNEWASRCGYSDHSAVSEAVRKAKHKLP